MNHCRLCHKPLTSTSAHASTCAQCVKKHQQKAANGWVYTRTHIHHWPNGTKTIELGTHCHCNTQENA